MKPVIVLIAAAALLAGCESIQSLWSDNPKASATLAPTKGSSVKGSATFEQRGDKVRISANVSGLRPNGEFGFHIHEVGDCSSGDGMSTKGHYNPQGKPHAAHSSAERHAGDLPSLKSDGSGNATMSADIDIITVNAGPTSIIGRGLIVHAQPDDFKTQPTGNAGARSACGVIQRS
jgi:Cu-Zn family superoxide dismutase